MPQLEKIIIYPIKSIGHIELKNSIVNEEGLEWDRKWMLVDDQGKFITQREFPELNLIRIKELETDFLIMDPENNFVLVPKYISSSSSIIKFEVEIWGATFDAEVWNPLASQWISDYLEQRVMLVRMIDKSRIKKSEYWKQEFPVYFSDAYPILLVNHNSVKLAIGVNKTFITYNSDQIF
ncbi:MAG: MOSC N-terminal beta barrel domain-containing protein [Saprospiraceae bacterium]